MTSIRRLVARLAAPTLALAIVGAALVVAPGTAEAATSLGVKNSSCSAPGGQARFTFHESRGRASDNHYYRVVDSIKYALTGTAAKKDNRLSLYRRAILTYKNGKRASTDSNGAELLIGDYSDLSSYRGLHTLDMSKLTMHQLLVGTYPAAAASKFYNVTYDYVFVLSFHGENSDGRGCNFHFSG
ncbi:MULTISPECIES: hypothetical protein [Frankia]|uniref:Secreted protein n=1 Tax=Frankia alni (strain DSM 45986 / CECT 9034 / ACN14a) TaxID=326424 RepID=Q0RBT4_FRAAA|nr:MULTISPECIES: hypothetical protein [Frankia]CAJ65100.1 hypothetical protein FRAAL6477 [Frankia alni ACN14a]